MLANKMRETARSAAEQTVEDGPFYAAVVRVPPVEAANDVGVTLEPSERDEFEDAVGMIVEVDAGQATFRAYNDHDDLDRAWDEIEIRHM